MNNYVVYGILGISLAINGYQVYRIDNYKNITTLMDQKDRLQQSGYAELLYSQINGYRESMIDNAKSQGKIEGILSVVNNAKPDQNEISAIWHSGYYRGMDQVEYVRGVSYDEGYHKACDDMNCPAGGGSERHIPNPKKNMSDRLPEIPSKPQTLSNPLPGAKENKEKPIIDFKPLPEKK
jgi:hypothetical protein